MSGEDRKYWLDEPGNVKKIIWALFAVCAALFLADAFYHKHSHFEAENFFGFYAIFGFVVCVALVLAAKGMRVFLMRSEDYYDAE
jgi:phosphatidylserine synthase